MAKIINKRSPEILTGVRAKGYPFISIKAKGFHITKQTAFLCGLKSVMFIHFINDNNYWAFYANNDPDGFPICADHSNGGFVLYSRQLSKLFQDSTGAKINDRFFVVATTSTHQENKIFEICTTKTVEATVDDIQKVLWHKKLEREYVLKLKRNKNKQP